MFSCVRVAAGPPSAALGTNPLLHEASWTAKGRPDPVEVECTKGRVPSCLTVHWTGRRGANGESIWCVNVADPRALPPPTELAELTLDQLIDILCAGGPLHRALNRSRGQKRTRREEGLDEPAIDPHARVDTSNFLLRRVRRISRALAGLQLRLEAPLATREALAWRLHGPVGPLALARRLAHDEGEGACFMIAEVALTLARSDWAQVERFESRALLRKEIRTLVRSLEELARETPAPANLRRYASECFREAHR